MGFVRLLQAAACLSLTVLQAAAVPCASRSPRTPVVALPQGTVHGFRDSHGNPVYLGIPFAQTTGGQNR